MKFLILNIRLQDEKEKDKEKEKEKEKADERVCKLRFVDKSFGARQIKQPLLGKFSRPIWFFAWMEVIFVSPKADFFWIFQQKPGFFSDWNQQILWPVFFSPFIFVWPPWRPSVKSGPSPNGTCLLVPGRLPWLVRTRIPTWKCSAPRLRWFCSWFLVYDLPGLRGKNVFQAYV